VRWGWDNLSSMRKPEEESARLEAMWSRAREEQWKNTPEHIQELGGVVRRSVDQDVAELEAFLSKHEIPVDRERLEEFRDLLIVKRVDLKDLEPAARARLRARTLQHDDPRQMTADYSSAASAGEVPRCRDCRWFVAAPQDGSPTGDKPCTALGTKGSDQACFGFTKSSN